MGCCLCRNPMCHLSRSTFHICFTPFVPHNHTPKFGVQHCYETSDDKKCHHCPFIKRHSWRQAWTEKPLLGECRPKRKARKRPEQRPEGVGEPGGVLGPATVGQSTGRADGVSGDPGGGVGGRRGAEGSPLAAGPRRGASPA